MEKRVSRHYTVFCPVCGQHGEDDGVTLSCGRDHGPALLRSDYTVKEFAPQPDTEGLFRYRDWLPVARTFPTAARTAVFQSEELSAQLGLPNLWIAFNGYWPERGAFLETATFKELEAYAVLGRLPSDPPVLVVASAGNTAAAFASICSRHRRPCLLIVPRRGLDRMRFRAPLDPTVRLVVLDGADYSDAIALAESVASLPGFQAEGGVRNIGRRDGLATVLYAGVEAMGRMPGVYVQAVGSGAGAIAVHEAAARLIGTGRYGTDLPRLLLCQNASFAPLADSWKSGTRQLAPCRADDARAATRTVFADELTNRFPPYAVRCGVYDVLTESSGDVLTVEQDAAEYERDIFGKAESVDIEPASAVALAGLRKAVLDGRVPEEEHVLLNITGGGRARLAQDHPLYDAEPALVADLQDGRAEDLVARIAGLFPDRTR
ncbi:L-threonine synthase [Streptomyces sp. WM6372]|uniref:cysteate synthase n=1 Tax=Streptomyces sp. WM6372 TaxID=1415555 RepID=UPI0006C648B3|nr:cysteate synthase [Streptomyces sp. WM6372]KOU27425.1 L-threonine synthase [Streptomyces sp. WM6372]